MGELPSHPELLDWLAVDFREIGLGREAVLQADRHVGHVSAGGDRDAGEAGEGSRRIGCSLAGRASAWTPRWFATTRWRRAGCWCRKIGGPSVKPYQPAGVWEAVAMHRQQYARLQAATRGENLYRRSMYTFWKRSAPPASMDIFNAPAREVCTVRRERTNTPLQALVTLNDPQFVEAARVLAQRTLKDGGADEATKADFLAARLLSRPLTERGTPDRRRIAGRSARVLQGAAGRREEADGRRENRNATLRSTPRRSRRGRCWQIS